MKISIKLKKILASFFLLSGNINKRLRNKNNKEFLILMYHRVLPKIYSNQYVQPGMYVTPKSFELHVQFLLKHFQIVPLSMLPYSSNGVKTNKPFCCITFDDGWQDFYQYAYPILKKYKAYATVFLPTAFIGKDQLFWTDHLASVIFRKIEGKINQIGQLNADIEVDPVVQYIESLRGTKESQLELAIQEFKKKHNLDIKRIINKLSFKYGSYHPIKNRAFLSWGEIKEMYDSGFVTFGSHTNNHLILTTLNENEIQEELIESKKKLISKKVVDKSFIPFCYPNGNFNEKIVKLIKEKGYSMAVSTINGWNDSHTNPYLLRRVGVHQDIASNMAMFGSKILNLL